MAMQDPFHPGEFVAERYRVPDDPIGREPRAFDRAR